MEVRKRQLPDSPCAAAVENLKNIVLAYIIDKVAGGSQNVLPLVLDVEVTVKCCNLRVVIYCAPILMFYHLETPNTIGYQGAIERVAGYWY
jgi:hypothetical protein